MRPLGKNVIVKRAENDKVTPSGVILPDSKATNDAFVVFVGKDVTDVAVNDKVLLDPKGKVNKFYHEGTELYMVKEDEIQAVYEN